jgi:acyl-CoA synthetase (AMP-forming)/AMP-acid ligase II
MNWNPEFNVATSFVDRNVLEGRARRTAIECGDEKVSYEQLLDRTNRAGNVLLQLGVRAEERVLLMLLDTPEFLYCFFGAIKIGAVAVPVNTLLKPDEYEYLFNTARARVAATTGIDRAGTPPVPAGNYRCRGIKSAFSASHRRDGCFIPRT